MIDIKPAGGFGISRRFDAKNQAVIAAFSFLIFRFSLMVFWAFFLAGGFTLSFPFAVLNLLCN